MRCHRCGLVRLLSFCTLVLSACAPAEAGEPREVYRETAIRAGMGRSIVAVKHKPRAYGAAAQRSTVVYPHPRPRLAGFSPLVAISASDDRTSDSDFDFEHVLRTGYVGDPLVADTLPSRNFIIGFLDSGAVVDLVAGVSASLLGFSGEFLTTNPIPIEGVGGSVTAVASMPVSLFAAGLDAISATGLLDVDRLVGHTNVSVVVAPSIQCDSGEELTAVIGTPLMAFHSSVIRVDTPRTVTVRGEQYTSPDVQILPPFSSTLPITFSMPMYFGGISIATTASYFPDFLDLTTPLFPTSLAFPEAIPLGGAFFAEIEVGRGDESNTVRTMRVLVDTGAQSSIMSSGMAALLNMPFEPDFTVEVCGVGGTVDGVPGYYIDYVRFNGFGGPLEFSHAPFVIIDITSPDFERLDGILGMNFFWNRNVAFEPALLTAGFISVSDPIAVPFGDNNVDFDVDGDDYNYFASCLTDPFPGTVSPPCDHLDGDADGDVDLLDFARLQLCFSGADNTADPECGDTTR